MRMIESRPYLLLGSVPEATSRRAVDTETSSTSAAS